MKPEGIEFLLYYALAMFLINMVGLFLMIAIDEYAQNKRRK